MKNILFAIIIGLLLFLVIEALGFLIISGLYWIICWAFSLVFSWKIAIGVFAVYTLLCAISRAGKGNSNNE